MVTRVCVTDWGQGNKYVAAAQIIQQKDIITIYQTR